MAKRPYKSPVAHAREILAKLQAEGPGSVSRRAAAAARRIANRLEPLVARDLEAVQAPYRVARWVAWAKGHAGRRQRADLAIHLRHTIKTSQGGWPEETQLQVALGVWQEAIDKARRRGVPQPRAEDVAAAKYEAAIRAVTRSARRAPAKAAGARVRRAPLLLTDEERAALAVLPVLEGLLRRVG